MVFVNGRLERRGEHPLLAFVSSVMNEDMGPARDAVAAAFLENAVVTYWMFEHTPASSDSAVMTYLDKVREADVFIWLVGPTLTDAVATEVRLALSCNRRMWVFVLTDDLDQRAQKLLKDVGSRVKWKRVEIDELVEAVKTTLEDETIRALRRVRLPRSDAIQRLYLESRARTIVGWQAAGLSRETARSWADDPSVGAPVDEQCPDRDRPLVILVAELGAGKSLAAERVLQQACTTARTDPVAPIPVHLDPREAAQDFVGAVTERARSIGDVDSNGCVVVIDGIESVGSESAARLVDGGRLLVETNDRARVLFTSRPISSIQSLAETVRLRPLSQDEALELASRVAAPAGVRNLYGLPQSIRESTRRPLFAILYGLYVKQRDGRRPSSMAAMFEFLVRRALRDTFPEGLITALEAAAVASIDRDGAPVRVADIPEASDLAHRLALPVVIEDEGWLSFPLPILMEWFAASSLARGVPSPRDLLSPERKIDRWRYPVTVLAGTRPEAEASPLLDALARADPAMASIVVDDGISQWGPAEGSSVPLLGECARSLRRSMGAWVAGLGPIGRELGPMAPDWRLRTLGLGERDGRLSVSWHTTTTQPDFEELPREIDEIAAAGWGDLRQTRPSAESTWAWRWTHEDLRHQVEKWVSDGFLAESGDFLRAEAWEQAIVLLGLGSLHDDPLRLEELNMLVEQIPPGTNVLAGRRAFDPRALRTIIEASGADGLLKPPWPGPDLDVREPRKVWDDYSDDRLLERTRRTFEVAIEGYQQIVDRWFPALRQRLATWLILPVDLRGVISRMDSEDGAMPVVNWHFFPLPPGHRSTVSLRLADSSDDAGEYGAFMPRELSEEIHVEIRRLRNRSEWVFPTGSSQVVDHFSVFDANAIAYEWLWSDLRRVRWVSSRNYRRRSYSSF